MRGLLKERKISPCLQSNLGNRRTVPRNMRIKQKYQQPNASNMKSLRARKKKRMPQSPRNHQRWVAVLHRNTSVRSVLSQVFRSPASAAGSLCPCSPRLRAPPLPQLHSSPESGSVGPLGPWKAVCDITWDRPRTGSRKRGTSCGKQSKRQLWERRNQSFSPVKPWDSGVNNVASLPFQSQSIRGAGGPRKHALWILARRDVDTRGRVSAGLSSNLQRFLCLL